MNSNYTRDYFAQLIFDRLVAQKIELIKQYAASKDEIGFFTVDNLLPEAIAREIYNAFPSDKETVLKKSIREYKHVAVQMDKYNPILEEIIYAFQDPRIVEFIGDVCDIKRPEPDSKLYAGGLSMMTKDNFLNPHLDNSHDKDRNKWRVLNLLYYVTPDWEDSYGGHLEIWPKGLEQSQQTLHSRFNRLAVMATHQDSWHSVSPVTYDGKRCCVSNYYFSNDPLRPSDAFHVTSFRGRPDQKIRDFVLRADSKARMLVRKFFKKGIRENPHVYKKE